MSRAASEATNESRSTGEVPSNDDTLLVQVCNQVTERFARIGGLPVLAVFWDLDGSACQEDPPPNPGHPACASFAASDYCRESWQLHLAALKDRRETHRHTCDYGLFCALVPLVCRGKCLAAFKLACPNTMSEEHFDRNVELLELLVEHAVLTADDDPTALPPAGDSAAFAAPTPEASVGPAAAQGSDHPQIVRACMYIVDHLSDPKLTVRRTADELGMHPDYLAHLFTEQVGERMSRYIAACRIERAKHLLLTTDWQVKRIAHECGYANPNWFSHVFGKLTGITASDYRRNADSQA